MPGVLSQEGPCRAHRLKSSAMLLKVDAVAVPILQIKTLRPQRFIQGDLSILSRLDPHPTPTRLP